MNAPAPREHFTPNIPPAHGNSSGQLAAVEHLLRRELAAFRRVDMVLTLAVQEEAMLGVQICTPAFEECLESLALVGLTIAREVARVKKAALALNRPEGAAVPVAH